MSTFGRNHSLTVVARFVVVRFGLVSDTTMPTESAIWQDVKDLIGQRRITLGGHWSFNLRKDPKRFPFVLARYKFAAKIACKGADVLELGCSEGIGTPILAEFAKSYTGVDMDADAVAAQGVAVGEVFGQRGDHQHADRDQAPQVVAVSSACEQQHEQRQDELLQLRDQHEQPGQRMQAVFLPVPWQRGGVEGRVAHRLQRVAGVVELARQCVAQALRIGFVQAAREYKQVRTAPRLNALSPRTSSPPNNFVLASRNCHGSGFEPSS